MSGRIKYTEVAAHREKLLKKQRGICPLCRLEIEPDNAALDHCHDTGHVRAVLHKQCNRVEGRVLRWARRTGKTDPDTYLRNLLRYWKRDFSNNPIHPTHGKKKRRRRKRA